MTKVIVVRIEKDRKQDRDLSLGVRFSAKLNIRKLKNLCSDKKTYHLWLQVLLIYYSH